ncbi:MAG: cobalamin B12-binding domain-containing protein [Pseudomonadota bacterium]
MKALAERSQAEPPQKFDTQYATGASALFNTIEGEIIPRLMLAHRGALSGAEPEKLSGEKLTEQDHQEFLQYILHGSATSARQHAEMLLKRGVPREDLLLGLLAEAARKLGEMWEQDLCDFTEVTIGLCRLHEIVRKNSPDKQHSIPQSSSASPRILLATACGDQHVFGVVIVADFFRRAGWRVSSEPGATEAELVEILAERHFDVLGLSAACGVIADDIAGEIKNLRSASSNKDLKVLVGGRLFLEDSELIEKVGADAFAGDARSATEIGQNLLAAVSAHC